MPPKINKFLFNIVLYLILFIRIFFIKFSPSESSDKISISFVINLDVFHSLTAYLNFSINWINQYYWSINALRAFFWYFIIVKTCFDFPIVIFFFSFKILFLIMLLTFFQISLYFFNNFESFIKKGHLDSICTYFRRNKFS